MELPETTRFATLLKRFETVPESRFSKIVARVARTIHDDDGVAFTEAEKVALAGALKVEQTSSDEIINGIHYVLESAAFHGVTADTLGSELVKGGCAAGPADAFRYVWASESARILRAMRHVSLGGPSELRSSRFERRMGGGSGGITGDVRPVVLLDLEFGSERPAVAGETGSSVPAPSSGEVGESGDGRGKGIYSEGHEHLRLEFDEDALFEFFGQLDDIQEQLDSLQ